MAHRAFRLMVLAAFALALADPTAGATPPTVTIILDNYSFEPAPIMLAAGQPVRLAFVNRSGRGHDFTAPEFFAGAHILAGAAPRGKVNLAAGGRATIDLIPAPGTYKVHCSKFTHGMRGMKTRIVVDEAKPAR